MSKDKIEVGDIYVHNGLYYITKDGEIISPAFVSLKDAWKNAWKYQ